MLIVSQIMLDFTFVTRSQALKGDFPLKYDYALKVKQTACTQIVMTDSKTAELIVPFICQLVDVRSVKIVHVDDFDDEL